MSVSHLTESVPSISHRRSVQRTLSQCRVRVASLRQASPSCRINGSYWPDEPRICVISHRKVCNTGFAKLSHLGPSLSQMGPRLATTASYRWGTAAWINGGAEHVQFLLLLRVLARAIDILGPPRETSCVLITLTWAGHSV